MLTSKSVKKDERVIVAVLLCLGLCLSITLNAVYEASPSVYRFPHDVLQAGPSSVKVLGEDYNQTKHTTHVLGPGGSIKDLALRPLIEIKMQKDIDILYSNWIVDLPRDFERTRTQCVYASRFPFFSTLNRSDEFTITASNHIVKTGTTMGIPNEICGRFWPLPYTPMYREEWGVSLLGGLEYTSDFLGL